MSDLKERSRHNLPGQSDPPQVIGNRRQDMTDSETIRKLAYQRNNWDL